jgi:ribosomal-protein-alanine N-acetyltransferase
MQIQTSRLLLREYIASDFEDMLAYESDPLVVQYVCYGPYTKEACRQQLAWHIAHQSAQPRNYYHLGIVLREENRLIGWCGLEVTDPAAHEAEIGYALHRRYWGKGYMTEAAAAMLRAGFNELQFRRIIAICHPGNAASIRVLEKLELVLEGILSEHKWCRGKWRDSGIFGLSNQEWLANNESI